MKLLNFILIYILVLLVSACGNNRDHMPIVDLHAGGNQQQGGEVSLTGPYYLSDVLPIINNKCAPCHASGATLDWTIYGIIKTRKAQIEQRVLSANANMPIGKVITAEEKEVIRKWLAVGMPYAPENLPEPIPPHVPVPAPPQDGIPIGLTYEKDALPIFKLYCSLCHNENSGGKIPNWLRYENALNRKDNIKAKMIDKSMPLPGAHIMMADEVRQKLIDWVDQGAIRAPISYREKVFPIIQNQCANCHNSTTAPPQYNWLNYETITSRKIQLYEKLVTNKSTHPNPPLSEEDFITFKVWLETGAQQ